MDLCGRKSQITSQSNDNKSSLSSEFLPKFECKTSKMSLLTLLMRANFLVPLPEANVRKCESIHLYTYKWSYSCITKIVAIPKCSLNKIFIRHHYFHNNWSHTRTIRTSYSYHYSVVVVLVLVLVIVLIIIIAVVVICKCWY